MLVRFHGVHSPDEAQEHLLNVLKVFEEQYGIAEFRGIDLHLTLCDELGEDVELVDTSTAEVLSVFEVYKADEAPDYVQFQDAPTPPRRGKPDLRLVVDNTRK